MTLSSEALAEQRLAELMTLNELGLVVSSTLDRDELVDRALVAVTRHLRFDRALIMLVDAERRLLTSGRSVGGSAEMAARIEELALPIDLENALLARIARSDGPLLFRDVDQDPDDGNREFARLLDVTSFLGTPLVTKGRTVGVLAVDNRQTGRDVLPGDGPLLYTVASLIAGGIENARLYAEVEEQKAALERRVVERTADLVDARRAAEEATESKSRFLSNVSHELRTPLTSVVGFSKLIARRLDEVIYPAVGSSDDPKVERAMRQVRENLAIIVEEGDRLTALINETLDLAKIEAGKVDWRAEPVDVADVIARASAATASLIQPDHGPRLRVETEPDLPWITGDRDRLIQVVINLISNAVKFTPEGSITIIAWHDPSDGVVQVAVSDTGIGIAPGDQAKVFEPFAQAGDTLPERPHGTGLGLKICREIVEHHGGRIWVDSRLGAGSTFQFTLPVESVSAAGNPRT
ncbi:MAG TPA: GAF domain-containing sensor histidine kinase [Candidatus Limnocylindrales bacterium]|jgi:signal transduction histidine kinase|nr:GAF domain-containing sensor histidine kinase [Candidatus Limnocylindrales bacterium]